MPKFPYGHLPNPDKNLQKETKITKRFEAIQITIFVSFVAFCEHLFGSRRDLLGGRREKTLNSSQGQFPVSSLSCVPWHPSPFGFRHSKRPFDRRYPRGLDKFLQKSIDMLLRVRLKDAPSLALACSAAGELTTGKNKKSGKNRKKC